MTDATLFSTKNANPPPLWSHQANDITRYLQDANVFNMSEPGTGKTRVIIETVARLQLPTLILAPKSTLGCVWREDFKTFAPSVSIGVAYAQDRDKIFAQDNQVTVTNIDALVWMLRNPKYMAKFHHGFLVIDESTSLKSSVAQRTKAAMKLRPLFKYASCMSGTPSPQGVQDLWSQAYIIDQGERLGASYYRFRNSCYTPKQRPGTVYTEWVEKEGAAEATASLLEDIVVRNLRKDCMDLPPNHLIIHRVELPEKTMREYRKLQKDSYLEVKNGTITAINAASKATKLLQLLSGAVYNGDTAVRIDERSQREELVGDLVDVRKHSVVFFQWKHQREGLSKEMQTRKLSYAVIDGSVTGSKREETIARFQNGEYRVLLCQVKSAAHGITLTRGTAVIFASPPYDPQDFQQGLARIFRGGQTRETETILLLAKDTIEDTVVYPHMLQKDRAANYFLELLTPC